MNLFLLTLLFTGFAFIIIGYINSHKQCPASKIEYRYVPRNFIEEQLEPVKLTDQFYSMFHKQSPWIDLLPSASRRSISNINQFWVSQY